MLRYGMIWVLVVWYGMVECEKVCIVQFGMVYCSVVCYGRVSHGMLASCDFVWYSVASYGIYGMVVMASACCSMVR